MLFDAAGLRRHEDATSGEFDDSKVLDGDRNQHNLGQHGGISLSGLNASHEGRILIMTSNNLGPYPSLKTL